MDEGTFTYVGRKDSSHFSDRIIDNYLKKLAYGRWWDNPPTVGASRWISDAYVAFPDLIHPLLRSKRIHHLDKSYFSDPRFKELTSLLIEQFSINVGVVEGLTYLLTLPHESVMSRVPNYADNIIRLVTRLAGAEHRIGIKYHPRNSGPDVLQLGGLDNVDLVPAGIPFECLLPMLEQCQIIGDMSSTLLTTKWLRPDLSVLAIENRQSAYFDQFRSLFAKLAIKLVTVDDLLDQAP